jgi:hypothetical protein
MGDLVAARRGSGSLGQRGAARGPGRLAIGRRRRGVGRAAAPRRKRSLAHPAGAGAARSAPGRSLAGDGVRPKRALDRRRRRQRHRPCPRRGAVPRLAPLGLGGDRRPRGSRPTIRAARRRRGSGRLWRRAGGAARPRGGRTGTWHRARGLPELSDAAAGWRSAGTAGRPRPGRERRASRCAARAWHARRRPRRRRAHPLRRPRRGPGQSPVRTDLRGDGCRYGGAGLPAGAAARWRHLRPAAGARGGRIGTHLAGDAERAAGVGGKSGGRGKGGKGER